MIFSPSRPLMDKAKSEGYAVGAFNTNNLEITKAIVRAAEEENAPLILQTSVSAIKYAGLEYLAGIARTAAVMTGIPLALHLDHGDSLETVLECIRHSYSSVMFDGSRLPYEENVAITQKVIESAQPEGISVEAELGKLVSGTETISTVEREEAMTDPEEAREFVERTGIDALAVSIGNAHGWYKGEPDLDFQRLEEIRKLVDIPLVLHGASGIPDEMIRTAIEIGIDKINIDTEIRNAFRQAVAKFVEENPEVIDPRKILIPAIEAMTEVVRKKIRLFGSSGRA